LTVGRTSESTRQQNGLQATKALLPVIRAHCWPRAKQAKDDGNGDAQFDHSEKRITSIDMLKDSMIRLQLKSVWSLAIDGAVPAGMEMRACGG
jgi:hypothetical protein